MLLGNCWQVCLRAGLQLRTVNLLIYVFGTFRCTGSRAKYDDFGISGVHKSEKARSQVRGDRSVFRTVQGEGTRYQRRHAPHQNLCVFESEWFSSRSREHLRPSTSYSDGSVYLLFVLSAILNVRRWHTTQVTKRVFMLRRQKPMAVNIIRIFVQYCDRNWVVVQLVLISSLYRTDLRLRSIGSIISIIALQYRWCSVFLLLLNDIRRR